MTKDLFPRLRRFVLIWPATGPRVNGSNREDAYQKLLDGYTVRRPELN